MCIIAAIPKGKQINEDTFMTCWENNPDGTGMMYVNNGKIIVTKELYDIDKLWRNYQKATKLNTDIVLHFRIGTSGTFTSYNIHPFKVNSDLWFCHNGILKIDVPKNSKENDTQIFNNTVLKLLPKDFIYNHGIIKLITDYIGVYNKFVFLDSTGTVKIINKGSGIMYEGIWFSNNTYKPYIPFTKAYINDKKADKKANKYEAYSWDEYTPKQDSYFERKELCDSCGETTDFLYYATCYNMEVCSKCYAWVTENENYNYNNKNKFK